MTLRQWEGNYNGAYVTTDKAKWKTFASRLTHDPCYNR